MMKLSSLGVLGVVFSSITTSSVVTGTPSINDPSDTCRKQQNCLMIIINENPTPTICGSQCEYQVCWHQLSFWSTRGRRSFADYCMRFGNMDFIGDMHHDGALDGGGCVNERNSEGKGYWDQTCLDPATVWQDSYVAGFRKVCQNVAAGHTVHLLISDGGSCSGTGQVAESTKNGMTAYCAPSTQDLGHTNPGGQTFFPSTNGEGGGTCSGADEGTECVWSITVPNTCKFEEGIPHQCIDNDNHDTVCPEMDSVLKYYENTKNDPPPIVPIHNITIHGNGTVRFKVKNPFGSDLHDIYTVYHSADGKGNEVCEKEMSAMECPQDKEFTALCMDDGAWTFVTIFATGLNVNSGAAILVRNQETGIQEGSDVYDCCPTAGELSGHLSKEYTAAWSYLIHCECDEAEEAPVRALQVSNDLVERFQRGELFDDELKEIYGISI
jgi:hypothetical protein